MHASRTFDIPGWRATLGGLAMFAALVFPLEQPPFGYMLYQIWAGVGLGCAALLWGFARVPRAWTIGWMSLAALILARANPYPDLALTGAAYVTAMYLGLCAGAAMHGGPRLRAFLLALAAAAAANALVGLLQFLGLGLQLYPWVPEVPHRGLAFGVFRQPNPFATFLCLGLVAAAWLLHRGVITRGMAWLLAAVLAAGIAAAGSRIGLLGVVLLAVLGALAGGQRAGAAARALLVGQAALYLGFVMLMPVLAQLHGFESGGVAERMGRVGSDSRWVLWRNAVELWREHPWWGWGWREFGFAHYAVPLHQRFGDEAEVLDNAHNLLLHLAVELGAPVALAVVLGPLALLALQLRRTRLRDDVAFALAGIAIVLQHSMVEFPLWTISLAFMAAVFTGLCIRELPQPPGRGRWERLALPALCVGLLAFALAAERQYARITRVYQIPRAMQEAKAQALREVAGNWLFRGTADYLALIRMEPTPENAREVQAFAQRVLHATAEPVVIAKVLEASWVAGDEDAVRYHLPRFRTAYPRAFQRWREGMASTQPGLAAWMAEHPQALNAP